MCTAASFKTHNHYFGRTLDYEFSYNETVTVTPRRYPFKFRRAGKIKSHYAIIGMAFVQENFPLYYEASNETGLSMAGLNFPGYAVYHHEKNNKDNIAPFEFIPWVLSQCENMAEVRDLLRQLNITDIDFSNDLPASPLHWIICDKDECVVVESVKDGLNIYENPVKVMTNSPPFDFHLLNLAGYLNCTREEAVNRFAQGGEGLSITPYSRGMGSIGIPGDLSSASRFVKAAFTLNNSVCGESEEESVSQFFHILGSVDQQKGCCKVGGDKFEYTIYTSCCNTDTGVYYYTTYNNSALNAVDMHRENLDGNELISYPLITKQPVNFQN